MNKETAKKIQQLHEKKRIGVYSIYDMKAQTYQKPIFSHQIGILIREFTDVANDDKTLIGQHPEDFCLYHIGWWDDDNGVIESVEHQSLGKATNYLAPIVTKEN